MSAGAVEAPYIRLAKPSELDILAELDRKAFIDDPEFNYFGSVFTPLSNDIDSPARAQLQTFFRFFNKSCFASGGRISVVAVPEGDKEKLVAVAIWFPPGKRLTLGQVVKLIRSGLLSVVRGWGFNGVLRVGVEYPGTCEAALKRAYETKGLKDSPSKSWYLQLACTDPDAQGKGYMSKLIRVAFASAPSSIFTLEATTAKSRDTYQHFGFEVFTPLTLGKGKVNSEGLPARTSGEMDGVTIYSMVKWS